MYPTEAKRLSWLPYIYPSPEATRTSQRHLARLIRDLRPYHSAREKSRPVNRK
jgi:hypothetical protein